jgi:hypothetical protein
MATNPMVAQGVLNRVRCSVVVPNFTSLNITAPYMGRSFAKIEFEGNFVEQIGTGTGAVNSPEPYVFATVTVGLLRTQALAANWAAQFQTNSGIGPITIHSDTSAFPPITVSNAVIRHLDPGAYDGTDPVVRLALRGEFYINNDLWSYA